VQAELGPLSQIPQQVMALILYLARLPLPVVGVLGMGEIQVQTLQMADLVVALNLLVVLLVMATLQAHHLLRVIMVEVQVQLLELEVEVEALVQQVQPLVVQAHLLNQELLEGRERLL
jgi:ubiquinone biosynthesis protein Coq4